MSTKTPDEMFAEALEHLTSLPKSATGGTGLEIPATVEALRKSQTVDASAPGSIAAVARRLQLAHRVSTLQRDAVVNGHLDFVRAAGRRDAILTKATELAKAQGTPPPTADEVDAMLARKRAIGPRFN